MANEYGIFQSIVESDQTLNEGIKDWAKNKVDNYRKEQQRRRSGEDEKEVIDANPDAKSFSRSVWSLPGGKEHYGKFHPSTDKEEKRYQKAKAKGLVKDSEGNTVKDECTIEFI